MKKALFCILAAVLTAVAALAAPKTTTLLSPNGKLTVNLETGSGGVSYTVVKDGKPVYEIRDIRLVTGTETIPDGSMKVGKTRFMYDKFQPVVPLKFSTVVDEYNETEISLGKGVTMLLRVMDNAVAYRFVMDRKGDVEVYDDHFLPVVQYLQRGALPQRIARGLGRIGPQDGDLAAAPVRTGRYAAPPG